MAENIQLSKYMDSVVVIPAFEPTEKLAELVAELSRSGCGMIIVDDGSGDGYDDIWQRVAPCAKILRHNRNLGKGAALKTAFKYIRDFMPEVGCVVAMDSDGQHLPADMEHVALSAWTHPGTLVLGSRNFDGDVPLRSKLGNKITRFIFSFVAKTKVADTQTGLRAFDRSLLDYMIETSGERYEYEINVLLGCGEHGITIAEVPIRTVYLDSANSCSHFSGIRDSFRIYGNILKFASASLVSFLADYLMFIVLTAVFPTGALFIVLSNVLARVGSAALNYTLNAKAVFHDRRPASQTLPQYALLALGVLAANSLMLMLFCDVFALPPSIAKLGAEVILFVLSFTVQSRFIFRQKPTKEGGGSHALRTAGKNAA